VKRKSKLALLEFAPKLFDPIRQGSRDREGKVREAHIQEGLVVEVRPVLREGSRRHLRGS
jgi:hypothetical protein